MSAVMTELAEFFDTEDFAVAATIPGGRKLLVLFDALYTDALNVDSASPAAFCTSADAAGLGLDDQITIDGTTYRIIGVQPDGAGITTLRLHTL